MKRVLPVLFLGLLPLALAAPGCGNDGDGLDTDGDGGAGGTGGTAQGTGQAGSGGSGTGGDPGTAGMNAAGQGGGGVAGQGGSPGGGGMNQAGTGGMNQAGTGGMNTGGMNQAGTGGMSMMPSPECTPGNQCMAGSMCLGPCNRGFVRDCSCINGVLLCGACRANEPMMNADACPTAPQGKECGDVDACRWQAGDRNGVCLCVDQQFVCQGLPAPEGSAACPQEPNFKECQEVGSFCARPQNQFCVCTDTGRSNRWICGN